MAILEKAKNELQRQVGKPFPDLTLINRRGEIVRLSSFRGKRLAVLAGIGPCPDTVAWMRELEAVGWTVPPGFDELLVLVSYGANREWNRLARRFSKSYFVGFPLEDYLAIVGWYPTMYGVGADGTFEGFWSYDGFTGLTPSNGGAQPNTRMNLSNQPVTARACARPAPGRLAGYAQRSPAQRSQ
jgi:hypothetical protein